MSHPSQPLAISNHGKASIPATVAYNLPFDCKAWRLERIYMDSILKPDPLRIKTAEI